ANAAAEPAGVAASEDPADAAPVPAEVRRAAASPAMAPTRPPTAAAAGETAPTRNNTQTLAAVRAAVDENRVDIYLQPLVSLPQRKVRYYEAVTRLRDDK